MKLLQSLRALIRWPKTPETKTEAYVLGLLGLVFFLALLPALGYASREHRDGARRKLLREIKTELEQWFNDAHGFPLHPSGDLGWCGSTEDPDDWFFTDFLLRERHRQTPSHDPRHAAGSVLRYCPTVRLDTTSAQRPLAAGFFLEATLENQRPDSAGFNDEHKIFERTLTVGTRTFYRICGGAETQCGTEQSPDAS